MPVILLCLCPSPSRKKENLIHHPAATGQKYKPPHIFHNECNPGQSSVPGIPMPLLKNKVLASRAGAATCAYACLYNAIYVIHHFCPLFQQCLYEERITQICIQYKGQPPLWKRPRRSRQSFITNKATKGKTSLINKSSPTEAKPHYTDYLSFTSNQPIFQR